MHHVRLLLASALLMVGCAADDSPGAGGVETAVAPAPSADAAAPASDAVPEATASATAAVATEAPDSTPDTAPADSMTTEATTSETPTTETPATGTTATETSATAAPTTAAATTDPTTTEATTTDPTTTEATATGAPTTAAPTTAAPQPSVDGSVVFYEATCDVCHRADGEGSGADLSLSTLDLDAVIEIVRFGVEGTEMEGWDFEPRPPGLTREEIEAVAAYVMSLRGA